MKRPLPPLDHLRAFEAAGRHLSFKSAADELNVTPAAVGQRIRSLEAQLNIQLFVRKTRQIELTNTGRALLADVADGLAIIRSGLIRIADQSSERVLTVSTTNTFAEMCLLPHLPEFLRDNPGHDVRIVSTDEKLDPDLNETDLCIRFGLGNDKAFRSSLLTQDVYVPVAAPGLTPVSGPIGTPAEIAALPLIETAWQIEQSTGPRWRVWMANRGLAPSKANVQISVSVEAHAIRAALSGQGVALVNLTYVREEIDAGRLVRLLPGTGDHAIEFRHRILWKETRFSPLAQRFCNWMSDRLSA